MLSVLRDRGFLAIWLAQLVSSLGDYFLWLAMPITILKLTGSTTAMGTAMISIALPALLLGPLAGVMVDRWDRRRTMTASNVCRGLVVLLCLLVRSPDQVWILYLVGMLDSTCGQFFFPARNAAVPLVVKEEQLTMANGLLQVTMTVSMIAGAGLAGVAIEFLGVEFAFLADSVAYGLAALVVSFATVPRTTAAHIGRPGHPVRAVVGEMREGLLYLLGNRTLVGMLACNVVLMLGIGALNVVWVPFMQRTFGVGPAGLGAVDAAQGVGMAIGGVAVGYLALRMRKVTLVGGGLAWAGVMLMLVGASPAFAWVMLWAALAGLAIPLINGGDDDDHPVGRAGPEARSHRRPDQRSDDVRVHPVGGGGRACRRMGRPALDLRRLRARHRGCWRRVSDRGRGAKGHGTGGSGDRPSELEANADDAILILQRDFAVLSFRAPCGREESASLGLRIPRRFAPRNDK